MSAKLLSFEKYRKNGKLNLPSEEAERIVKQNQKLKSEVTALYQVLIQKEESIIKLRKFIQEELEKPEYTDNYSTLQEQLIEILKDEEAYDPRPDLADNHEEEEGSTRTGSLDVNIVNSKIEDALRNEENKQVANQIISVQPIERVNPPLSVSTAGEVGTANQEQLEASTVKEVHSPKVRSKSPVSPTKRKNTAKKPTVKPLEQETITRNLFSFELEIKEYSFTVFERIKPFVSRQTFTVDEIHDEIEKLAEIASQHKYFQTVFPEDTEETIANELENYMFEILHGKLFIVDEDSKGFNQQFKDRLRVLKQLVTFSMLEIPVALRREALFAPAIKELEKMSQFKSPVWKLKAFQNSVNYIVLAYHQALQREPCSDELFPLLVYIVLNSNVDLFKFNVDYIYKFLRKPHLLGQLGFLIINLKAVIQFLEDLNGNSLGEGKLEMRRF